MAQRSRPFAFLKLGRHWINLAMVTDIVDDGERLTIYLATDMARLAGKSPATALDVARRVTLTAPADLAKLRKWLKLNDEE